MTKGGSKAPICAPLLNTLVANPRSFFGKYSAVILMAAGKFPDSPMASTQRAARKSQTLTVDTVHMPSATVCNVDRFCRAPSKPVNHSPPNSPLVAIPQKAWRHAPADHSPMAHK